jgi:hypothetical protein
MEIEVKVSPHGSMRYYQIHWRKKSKYKIVNFFRSWNRLVEVWDGGVLTYDQPVLFSNFGAAVEFAMEIKNDPKKLEKHYEREDEIYERAKKRREEYLRERNQSKVI